MQGPVAAYLDGGSRLHLQHGPIDLILGAEDAEGAVVQSAFDAAIARFQDVLATLAGELPLLRSPLGRTGPHPEGPVARRMTRAAMPFAEKHFLSPMICVAGSVADEMLAAMCATAVLHRAYVNNGGDIAIWLVEGAQYSVAVSSQTGHRLGTLRFGSDSGIGGIATSGSGGRSLSLGIADSVTVLAASAAIADTAATLIANTIDLPDHPGIQREAARALQPDSDLGDRRVVTKVPPLANGEIKTALAPGRALAEDMVAAGQIRAAALFLQGQAEIAGEAFHDTLKLRENRDV